MDYPFSCGAARLGDVFQAWSSIGNSAATEEQFPTNTPRATHPIGGCRPLPAGVENNGAVDTFGIGEQVRFAGHRSLVTDVTQRNGARMYLIENGPERVPMWIPADVLSAHQAEGRPETQFESKPPHLLAVDDFFSDPDEVRSIALAQEY